MDNKKERRGGASGQAVSFFLYVLFGAFCGFFTGRFLPEEISSFLVGLIALFLFVAGIYLQIIIHEAGHLVCGLISGYGFGSYRIGSVMFKKEGGRIRIKKYSISGTAGQCLMIPPELYVEEFPVTLYNLGGGLFNLALSLILLGLFFLTGAKEFFAIFLLISAAAGVVLGALNLIPMRLGPLNNDGRNVLEMKRDPSSKRCFWVQLRMLHLLGEHIRLRDMPEAWFIMPPREKLDNSLWASAGVFACNRAVDELDFEKAKALGAELLEHADAMVGLHRNYIKFDMLFIAMLEGADSAKLEEISGKNAEKLLRSVPPLLASRINYARELLLNNDEAYADEQLKKFKKLAKRHPYPCEIESERELLSLARQRFEERRNTEKPPI